MKQDTLLLTIVKVLNCDHFKKLAQVYDTDRYSKFMTAQKALCIKTIVQIEGLISLRDIENYTEPHATDLESLGIPRLARSTFSEALQRMNSKVFEGLYYHLLESLNKKLSKRKRIKDPLAIIDSSTFHVGLKRFPWAHYKKAEGAFKMHLV